MKQHTGPVKQMVLGAPGVEREAVTTQEASIAALQQSGASGQRDTSVSDSNQTQEATASSSLAGAAVIGGGQDRLAVGVQQDGDERTSLEAARQEAHRRSSREVPGLSGDSGLQAWATDDLQQADSHGQRQDQQERTTMQLLQQQGSAPQHAAVEALEHQTSVDDELQPSTSQHSTSKQAQRGKSVYAPRDLTVLEQYEVDVVHAYAASFVAEAMMQGMLPAAANFAAADQHAKLLAEVREQNALNKMRHLEEVQTERATWEAHEETVKR